MSNEYRPRLRRSRRHPVTRKDNVVVATCKDADDAIAIQKLLEDIFKASVKYEKVADHTPTEIPVDYRSLNRIDHDE